MDLKSLGSIQLKKIMRHMSHTSQIWFRLIIALSIANVLAITRSLYWLRKSGAASMDLKSLGSIQLKKVMRHMSHTSQIWFCLIIALSIANVLAITRSFYWLRKSWTASTDLKSMGCIQLEKIKIHMSHMCQIWNCPIFARPIDCFYVVHWITFYWLLKRGQPCLFWSLLGPDKSKNHETHVSVSYVSD